MGLFGNKKEKVIDAPKKVKVAKAVKTEKVKTIKAKPATKKPEAKVGDISWVILKPRITEKAALLGDKNVFVFEVSRSATKVDVKNAVVELFKVTPVKINMINRSPRTFVSRARNRTSVHPGAKKAHVFLKKGDTINLV